MSNPLKIGFLLFKNAEMLDFAGPFQILAYCGAPNIIAKTQGPIQMMPAGEVVAEMDFANAPDFDMLIVPGGVGQVEAMEDEATLTFIRDQHAKGAIVASVCTGALILAKAGLLKGKSGTTHWMARGELGRMGVNVVTDRFVDEGQVLTAAGVSAGIDMAIHLVARELGEELAQQITLGSEYDPAPPFACGSPEKADPEMVARIRKGYRYGE